MPRAKRIGVIDSTLRNAQHPSDGNFTLSEKVEIAVALDHAGVDEIEVGCPSPDEQALAEIAEIAAALKAAQPDVCCQMERADVDAAQCTAAKRIYLTVPLSDTQLKSRLDANRAQALVRIHELVSYARDKGFCVSFSGEDASRADTSFVLSALRTAERAGAQRFRYADTLGILEPFAVHDLFKALRKETDLELEFHGHDDLGLAAANTIAAIRGGATHASVSVPGVGRLPGNAPLEEVIAGIKRFSLGSYRVRLSRLSHLNSLVTRAARRSSLQQGAPVTPCCETLIPVGQCQEQLFCPEPSLLRIFSDSAGKILRRYPGIASIANTLRSAGFRPSKRQLRWLSAAVRERALDMNRSVSAEELLELYSTICAASNSPEAAGERGDKRH